MQQLAVLSIFLIATFPIFILFCAAALKLFMRRGAKPHYAPRRKTKVTRRGAK